jgi:hypothetical protein
MIAYADDFVENQGVKTEHTPRRNDDTAKGRRVTRVFESYPVSLTGLRVDHEGVFEWNPAALLFDYFAPGIVVAGRHY